MSTVVLIITNQLTHEGGVVSYYNLFFKYFHYDDLKVKHFTIGSRTRWFYYPFIKRVLYPIVYFFDLIRFIRILNKQKDIKIIQLNPSLIPVPLIRDALLILILKLFNRNIIVFFMGWRTQTYRSLINCNVLRFLFRKIYLGANITVFVLAKSFKTALINLGGLSDKIKVTTTAIDKNDVILMGGNIGLPIRVLFLGRIQPEKGIEALIESVTVIYNSSVADSFKFSIAGHEYKTGYINSLMQILEIKDIPEDYFSFLGRKEGHDKYMLYSNNDIFILPSQSEGCPNSVIEALSSGMYCITTNVGALNDIIIPGFNGKHIPIDDPESIQKELISLVPIIEEIRSLRNKISLNSLAKFDIRIITELFKHTYDEILGKNHSDRSY